MSVSEQYEKWKSEGPFLALAVEYDKAVRVARKDPTPANLALAHRLGSEVSELRGNIRRAGRREESPGPRPEPTEAKRGFWARLFYPGGDE